ncbi:MAG: hypothetical protein ACYC91_13740 [Solirubrobacteraceae bacterium]
MRIISRAMLGGTAALLLGAGGLPRQALASGRQVAILGDDAALQANPAATLATMRRLGVDVARVYVRWSEIAPGPGSPRPPRHFNGADPADYPASRWAVYDAIVRNAAADGIEVDFTVGGGAPRWATGPGMPRSRPSSGPALQWRPSVRDYGEFVRAVATRYSGSYNDGAAAQPLPRVHFWEIWNEPNFGQDLAPQATDGSRLSVSPGIYRALLDAAWSSLRKTGHGRDTILIGSLSPRGFKIPGSRRFPGGLPGNFSTTKPAQFVRTLFCVDASYRPLGGNFARAAGCPTTTRGRRHFRDEHPALFDASGFGVHPYPYGTPPNRADSSDPDYAEFSELSRFGGILDRLQRHYGSRRRPPLYVTEFGYITDPPRRGPFPSPATAARYINWAEYLSWRNPRIASTMQFLLVDPNPRVGVPEYGGFSTGLSFFGGRTKPTYGAYRMAVFLPVTSVRHGHPLEIWGCVRPAHYAGISASGRTQVAEIQFRRRAERRFYRLATVTLRNPEGYFDIRVRIPASGTARVSWTYPNGQRVYSRWVNATVRGY